MHHFHYHRGQLYIEDCALSQLAEKHGTPLYVYSAQTILDHYDRLENALAPQSHLISYAMKANSNLAIVHLLAQRGSGFDVTSAGELYRVLKAGGRADRCTFVGVGKTRDEIEYGIREGIYAFNVESEAELLAINEIAGRLKKRAPFSIRVNPNVDAQTHKKITTGLYENKFGINYERVRALYARASKLKHLEARGVQIHIGSQITKVDPFVRAVQRMVPLVQDLKRLYGIEFFDVGGGMGIIYRDALASGQAAWWKTQRDVLTPTIYAERILPLIQPLGVRLLVEPGRYLVGNAGVLLTEVLYIKNTGRKKFVIVDAAMTELIRPTLYEAHHDLVPLKKSSGKKQLCDVVGPVCESGDYLAKDRQMPLPKPGERLAVLSAGAYGMVMASNYNARPRPAEILVQGSRARVVRQRETWDDLLRGEVV